MATKSLGVLTLDLIARTAGFVRGMDAAERRSAAFRKKIKRELSDVGAAMTRLTKYGVAGLTAAFGAVVAASAKQEDAIRQVEARLKSTGGAVGKTSKEIQALAAELQKSSTFGDEAILEMQSILLTFTDITGKTFDRTSKTVLDLSVAMGQDLKSSVVQLGKALNAPTANLSALSRVGIQFTDEQKDTIKTLEAMGDKAGAQAIILTELEKEFGGAAAAAADTFSGALKQTKNAFTDLLENPGGLQENKQALKELTEYLQDPETVRAAQELTGALITGFTGATRALLGFTRYFNDLGVRIGESIARATGGVALDDLESQIEKQRKFIEWAQQPGHASLPVIDEANKKLRELIALRNLYESTTGLQPIVPQTRFRRVGEEVLQEIETQRQRITPKDLRLTIDDLGIEVIGKKKEESEFWEKINDQIEAYNDLVKELRTDEEKITDELRDRLKVIEDIQTVSEEQKDITRQRAIAEAFKLSTDVGGVGIELGGAYSEFERLNEETAKIEEEYQERLRVLDTFRKEQADHIAEWDAQEEELHRQHAEAMAKIDKAREYVALSAAESLFGNLSDIARQFAGEQSHIFKIMFAAEKAAAIARSIVAINEAIALASASLPFPANLAAMATVAAETASIIANISAVTLQGQAHDGIMSIPKTGTYLLERGERVTTQETSAKLDKTLDNVSGRMTRIYNLFDREQVVGEYLRSPEGGDAVMNIVRENEATIRTLR